MFFQQSMMQFFRICIFFNQKINRPFHKGGKFLAPRTILKMVCWGEFCVYDNGKMSFENVMPIEDLGLPVGYKYTRKDKDYAIKHADDGKLKRLEKEYKRNLAKNPSKIAKDENLKYDKYFKIGTSRPQTASIASIKSSEKTPKSADEEFSLEIKEMISNLEKEAKSEHKPYDKDVIKEAKKALLNIAGISDMDI